MPILAVEVSRNRVRSSVVQSIEKSGASMKMRSGLTDWYHEAGNGLPKTTRSVFWSAKRVNVPPACSKPIQKTIEKTATIRMTAIRCHSSRVKGALGSSFSRAGSAGWPIAASAGTGVGDAGIGPPDGRATTAVIAAMTSDRTSQYPRTASRPNPGIDRPIAAAGAKAAYTSPTPTSVSSAT